MYIYIYIYICIYIYMAGIDCPVCGSMTRGTLAPPRFVVVDQSSHIYQVLA